jgi:hypothetical protein
LPSEGPPWMRTTRPTSTSLHVDALMSASPIVIDSERPELADEFDCRDEVQGTYWASLSRVLSDWY